MRCSRRLLASFCLLLVPGLSAAATHVVLPDGTGDYPTIQAAIAISADSDTIRLGDGVFSGPGNRDIDFLGLAIVVHSQSGDPTACVIDAGGSEAAPHRGFHFHSGEGPGSILESVGITNGDVTTNEPETYGGGIYLSGASPTIRDCRVWTCRAKYGGGIFTAPGAAPDIGGCTVTENDALGSGGGIYFWSDSAPNVHDCLITFNDCDSLGGGIQVHSAGGAITNCEIRNNSAKDGGGVGFRFECGTVMSGCTISNNLATKIDPFTGDGGAVYCRDGASPTITDCVMEYNLARFGGAISCATQGAPHVTGCTMRENSVSWSGGGIHTYDSSPIVEDCIVELNSSDDWGGGFAFNAFSHPTVSGCTVRGNTSTNTGGGFHVRQSTASISGCLVTGNTSADGGGIFVEMGSSADAEMTTVAGNRATRGGGLHVEEGSDLNLVNAIVWGNCVDIGGSGDEAYTVDGASSLTFACSDVDDSGVEGMGTVSYLPGNTFLDPLFCDAASCLDAPTLDGDYRIDYSSPAATSADCGLMGALDPTDCPTTRTEGASWGQIKSMFR
ncbi:MAG: right-handed parallel beta-helix repeat-containing protein [Candidatus Eisenbacteria bacterium]